MDFLDDPLIFAQPDMNTGNIALDRDKKEGSAMV